ncbi:MBL fold metallo-hydrolase [Staphylococcus equorum]|uniref:MBL fold metallo-hydrolase n=1 Tax=Staphylococcus equorum TaxID=246432 RepID=UPI000E052F20|nr:MBL fold metallo-hydrolase [Staphylococcus equorum]QQT23061.1 MBL fold metallo-hydrolase [Staphylococcus equorum]RTX76754.1 MBL fold metallo-hydrolase [Staphylococcus equorum subsp. equorum]SUM25697.1 metallo-beta-lactamase superfamily protein [Staphylococcus equorum]
MNITHVRNATLIVEYADKKFLIDPMLGEKGSFPPFPNAPRDNQNNPLVELPMSINEIITGVDAVILTHLHLDHFDEASQKSLPIDIKIYTQNSEDAEEVKNVGFTDVEALEDTNQIGDIQVIKTSGQHGRGDIVKIAGKVCGLIFQHDNEKSLYIAGDTVWYEEVEKTLRTFNPEIIVVNSGDNQFNEGGSLVMDENDIYEVAKLMPSSEIIVVHMEAVNHWNLSREYLKQFAKEKQFSSQLKVPNDGDKYTF